MNAEDKRSKGSITPEPIYFRRIKSENFNLRVNLFRESRENNRTCEIVSLHVFMNTKESNEFSQRIIPVFEIHVRMVFSKHTHTHLCLKVR